MSLSPDDALIGALIHTRYRLTREIGKGGMGTVYEGVHELTGRRVAVKRLQPEHRSPENVERILQEARVATRIGHPDIVEVLDAFSCEEGVFLAMELLAGETLAARIKREGPLSVRDAVEVVSAVAAPLAAAHARGVVHRDVKPANVFLRDGDTSRVKLLDFGVAHVTDTKLTVTGGIVGTPAYLSPEQSRGERDVDARTDVWALGVTLYECLTGTTPFAGTSLTDILVRIALEDPRDVRELRPDVPEAVATAITRALARERNDRYASVSEFRDALLGRTAPPARFEGQRRARIGRTVGGRALGFGVVLITMALLARAPFGAGVERAADAGHDVPKAFDQGAHTFQALDSGRDGVPFDVPLAPPDGTRDGARDGARVNHRHDAIHREPRRELHDAGTPPLTEVPRTSPEPTADPTDLPDVLGW